MKKIASLHLDGVQATATATEIIVALLNAVPSNCTMKVLADKSIGFYVRNWDV